tara:strand:+ start:125 stop:601 length:477 start_codon:yes stop_codon:yes gene_type:complete
MKKIIYLILLIVCFGCSKDDNDSGSGETFLKKFDNVGFVEDGEQNPSYFYFYDSNVFIKNAAYDEDFGEYECSEITDGATTLEIFTISYSMVTKITTNNSTTLKCEVTATALGISDTTTFEFTVNSSGDTLIVLEENSGEKDTYTYSKTDIPYSQICY